MEPTLCGGLFLSFRWVFACCRFQTPSTSKGKPMPMTFTSCIPAQNFGLASETTIPGFQPLQLSPPAPAQCVAVDPCHVFEESFLEDFVLWWTWHDTRTPLYIAGPTGCGKTTSVLQFLARVNVPVISVTCSRRFVRTILSADGAHTKEALPGSTAPRPSRGKREPCCSLTNFRWRHPKSGWVPTTSSRGSPSRSRRQV